MKRSEAAALLTLAAAYDNRTVARAQGEAWADALGSIRYQDAHAAVKKFFATPAHGYLEVSDVIELVMKMRGDRLLGIEKPLPPRELADMPRREIEWETVFRNAICDGAPRDVAINYANTVLEIEPDDEPVAIESTHGKKLREQFDAQMLELSRSKSLAESERLAKVAALRKFKDERAAEAKPDKATA